MKLLLERLRLLPLAMAISCGSAKNAWAQSTPEANGVHPLLEKYCFECHGKEKQKGKLQGGTVHRGNDPAACRTYVLIALPNE